MATNSAFANYQEIIDISTTPSKVGVFGIHTPSTMKPIQMLEGFFKQFRQFKYIGCDIKVQPAATLPMDPLGVSYEAGEVATDPRDLLNPIMVKGCHGETINNALDVVYRDNAELGQSLTRTDLDFVGSSERAGESAYYSALSDPTFKKYSVLQPFAMRGLHPMVHKVVGTMPIFPKQSFAYYRNDDAVDNDPLLDNDSDWNYPDFTVNGPSGVGNIRIPSGPVTYAGGAPIEGTFFTSKMENLGWLDTVSRPQAEAESELQARFESGYFEGFEVLNNGIPSGTGYKFNTVPKLFMSMMIMPPCYKSILTFRMVINHKFAFRGFSTARYTDQYEGTADYTSDLSDVATASVDMQQSASVDTINGDVNTVTEGVY